MVGLVGIVAVTEGVNALDHRFTGLAPAITRQPGHAGARQERPGIGLADFVPANGRPRLADHFADYNKFSSIAIRAIMPPRWDVFQASSPPIES